MHTILKLLVYLCIPNIICHENNDKLVLSPVELIDLVRMEQHLDTSPMEKRFSIIPFASDIKGERYPAEYGQEELEDDRGTLKNRKVWSRWSKWGKCSVSCGIGTLVRNRQCVSGRCAPGEREEQHRSCSRAPCISFNSTNDIHESD